MATAAPTSVRADADLFIQVRHSVLDYLLEQKLTPNAYVIYSVLTKHADWTTGETFASRSLLAKAIHAKQARAADKYIRELQDVGLITSSRPRWKNPADRDDVAFAPDDVHTAQTSNLYVIARTPDASAQVATGCAETHGGGCAETHTNENPLNENHLNDTPKSAPAASPRTSSKSVDKPKRKTPRPLPASWAPNETHRRIGADRGVDVDVAAAAMRAGAAENGKRLADWDRAFGALLNAIADDTWFSEFPWVADYDEVLTSQAVDQAVEVVAATVVPVIVDAEVMDQAVVEERLEAKIDAAAAQAPQPAGFSRPVVDGIEWVAARLGGLTDAERVEAGRMLTNGTNKSYVWTEIENARLYAAA